MIKKIFLLTFVAFLFTSVCKSQYTTPTNIITGAERLQVYLPLLKGKAVAVFANQTSVVGSSHLVDTLVKLGVNIKKIFGPEHGFRGAASAGEKLKDGVDTQSGLPVVSLYGSHKKPTKADLQDVDVVIFDIQDVGVRFYTYISSLEYMLDACVENNKTLLLLDRPNPNGFYVDGPVLNKKFKSFIGMQPIPIVHGMTMGEYAQMLLLEKWLSTNTNYPIVNIDFNTSKKMYLYAKTPLPKFNLHIITCQNYTHASKYNLPVNPSPNLPEMQSIYLYPSTCFFEGTVLSEGRGTPKPFQIYGHPSMPKHLYSFTPMPNEGAKSSKCYNQICYGYNLHDTKENILKNVEGKIQLKYLLEAYQLFPQKDSFFLANNFLHKLAGNDVLMAQIKAGISEKEIKKTWEKDLSKFKIIRKKYLLYKDF